MTTLYSSNSGSYCDYRRVFNNENPMKYLRRQDEALSHFKTMHMSHPPGKVYHQSHPYGPSSHGFLLRRHSYTVSDNLSVLVQVVSFSIIGKKASPTADTTTSSYQRMPHVACILVRIPITHICTQTYNFSNFFVYYLRFGVYERA